MLTLQFDTCCGDQTTWWLYVAAVSMTWLLQGSPRNRLASLYLF